MNNNTINNLTKNEYSDLSLFILDIYFSCLILAIFKQSSLKAGQLGF